MSKARVSQTKNNQNKSNKVASSVNANKVSSLPLPSASRKLSSSSLIPRVEPWNHKQFLKRVSTFNSLKWHIKRIDTNPLLCARFGWECIAKNTLQCTGCGTKIDYKTNNLYSIDVDNKIALAFLQNMKSAHTPSCEWKNNECNKSFEYLPRNIIMRQQLIENIKSWTITDNNSFYFIPSIHQRTKNLLIKSMHNHNDNQIQLQSFIKYDSCLNIMLLCACGWLFNTNKYIQCKYCNKCLALHSYDYKKIFQLLPQNNNNSFLHGINEEEEEEEEEDISSILTAELPTSDTKSVINRLSKLGLKMNTNIIRSHNFHIYETKSLQKQASFNNYNTTNQLQLSSFGTSFASYKCDMNGLQSIRMRWPKQSILTQSNSVSLSGSVKKNKKRRRNQMSIDIDEDDDDDICYENKMDESSECPRKRMRFSSNSVESNDSNDSNVSNVSVDRQRRKSRKRKSMDLECDESESVSMMISSEFVPISKKRRIDSDSLSLQESHGLYRTPIANSQKRSRKRKFKNVFVDDNEKKLPTKRVRVDTPTVHQKMYFDPINSHNDFCPFRNKYKYEISEKNNNNNNNNIGDVFGWNYCLKLLPNDIMYIQQISEQSKKCNQGKSRF